MENLCSKLLHRFRRKEGTRYFSIAGEMNPMQRQLLESAFQKLSPGASILLATNNDTGGRHLAEQIKAIALATGRADLALLDSHPEREGADWNDTLRADGLRPAPAADRPQKLVLRR